MGKLLIACEESQTVCKAFRDKGHEAYSCDIIDQSGGHPEWHIKGDAVEALYSRDWDLVIAHPPCTRLTNSGVCWIEKRDLWRELKEGVEFFNKFVQYGLEGNKIAIENPIPHKYARDGFNFNGKEIFGIGKYTQIIQPWQFGHGETKATCLWLFDLPLLVSTNIVEGREQRLHKLPPSPDRAKLRSKTYQGIADAMAAQWGDLI